MDLNKILKLTEQQKILGEISEESAYRKDMENYTNYGYAQGIVDTLKALKSIDALSGKEFYEIFIKNIGDEKLGNMVKRLLQD